MKYLLYIAFCLISASCKSRQNPGSNVLVVNGAEVKEGHPGFKNAVLILVERDRRFSLCSGSLISKDTILTAAHCFLKADILSNYKIDKLYPIVQFTNKVIVESKPDFPPPFENVKKFGGQPETSGTNIALGYAELASGFSFGSKDATNVANDMALIRINPKQVPSDWVIRPMYLGSAFIKSLYWAAVGFGLDEKEKIGVIKSADPSSSPEYIREDKTKFGVWRFRNWFQAKICVGDSGGPMYLKDLENSRNEWQIGGVSSNIQPPDDINSDKLSDICLSSKHVDFTVAKDAAPWIQSFVEENTITRGEWFVSNSNNSNEKLKLKYDDAAKACANSHITLPSIKGLRARSSWIKENYSSEGCYWSVDTHNYSTVSVWSLDDLKNGGSGEISADKKTTLCHSLCVRYLE